VQRRSLQHSPKELRQQEPEYYEEILSLPGSFDFVIQDVGKLLQRGILSYAEEEGNPEMAWPGLR
jgi:hypothetical protein